jgi:hypothetical protein
VLLRSHAVIPQIFERDPAEALLRNCQAYCETGRALDAAMDTS